MGRGTRKGKRVEVKGRRKEEWKVCDKKTKAWEKEARVDMKKVRWKKRKGLRERNIKSGGKKKGEINKEEEGERGGGGIMRREEEGKIMRKGEERREKRTE